MPGQNGISRLREFGEYLRILFTSLMLYSPILNFTIVHVIHFEILLSLFAFSESCQTKNLENSVSITIRGIKVEATS